MGVINGIAIFLKKNHPECLDIIDFKTIQSLESVEKNKAFQDVIEYASYTKIAIEKISTIDDIAQFVVDLCSKLFNKSYLK